MIHKLCDGSVKVSSFVLENGLVSIVLIHINKMMIHDFYYAFI